MNLKVILFICCTCCPHPVFCQDEQAMYDFGKLMESVVSNSNQYIEASYYLYPTFKSRELVQTLHAMSMRKGELVRHKLGPVETIQNYKYSLSIDHEDQSILIQDKQEQTVETMPGHDMLAAFESFTDVHLLTDEPTIKGYSIGLNLMDIERMDLFFDPARYTLKKLILYYRQTQQLTYESEVTGKPRLEIVYEKVDLSPTLQVQDFSEAEFVTRKNGTIVLQPKFRDYHLINYTNN